MIEDTNILVVLEKLLEMQEEVLSVQAEILKTLRDDGIAVRREYSKNIYSEPMLQEEKDTLDDDIDLDWWYLTYKTEFRPAKYMDRQGLGYTKRELDYIHKRLVEISLLKPEVNGGTHIFQYIGKKYCKAEKNSLNCFACVPKDEGVV